MTSILIAVASRHGATDEIAHEVADELRRQVPAAVVEVRDAADPGDLTSADALIVGSAIYLGRWLPAARKLVEERREQLATVPVWLFSSGPVGDPPRPADDLVEVIELAAAIGARGHRVFSGRLDRDGLTWTERLTVRVVHAEPGDFRDHDAIRSWATEVAVGLAAVSDVVPGQGVG